MTIYIIEYTDFYNDCEYTDDCYFTSRQLAEDYLLARGFKHLSDDEYVDNQLHGIIKGLIEKENEG